MKRFKNILLVYDGEQQIFSSLKRAVTLAENNQADLTIVRVFDFPEAPTQGDEFPYSNLQKVLTE